MEDLMILLVVLCFCISGDYFVYFGCCDLSIDVVVDDDYMF